VRLEVVSTFSYRPAPGILRSPESPTAQAPKMAARIVKIHDLTFILQLDTSGRRDAQETAVFESNWHGRCFTGSGPISGPLTKTEKIVRLAPDSELNNARGASRGLRRRLSCQRFHRTPAVPGWISSPAESRHSPMVASFSMVVPPSRYKVVARRFRPAESLCYASFIPDFLTLFHIGFHPAPHNRIV
jgi:hypothetical protein